MKLMAFCDTTPSHMASDSAWFSSPLPGAWGRGSTELPAVLASGERNLLPGGDHLPILHLLNNCADLTGRCHDCKRKPEDNYSWGRKEGNFLTHYQVFRVLKEDVWKMLFQATLRWLGRGKSQADEKAPEGKRHTP